jgi:hypothetical protein
VWRTLTKAVEGGQEHVVPLSDTAVAIIKALAGRTPYKGD